ncbi:hypothetical protein ACQY0O_006248 [Thecaphora frezii]
MSRGPVLHEYRSHEAPSSAMLDKHPDDAAFSTVTSGSDRLNHQHHQHHQHHADTSLAPANGSSNHHDHHQQRCSHPQQNQQQNQQQNLPLGSAAPPSASTSTAAGPTMVPKPKLKRKRSSDTTATLGRPDQAAEPPLSPPHRRPRAVTASTTTSLPPPRATPASAMQPSPSMAGPAAKRPNRNRSRSPPIPKASVSSLGGGGGHTSRGEVGLLQQQHEMQPAPAPESNPKNNIVVSGASSSPVATPESVLAPAAAPTATTTATSPPSPTPRPSAAEFATADGASNSDPKNSAFPDRVAPDSFHHLPINARSTHPRPGAPTRATSPFLSGTSASTSASAAQSATLSASLGLSAPIAPADGRPSRSIDASVLTSAASSVLGLVSGTEAAPEDQEDPKGLVNGSVAIGNRPLDIPAVAAAHEPSTSSEPATAVKAEGEEGTALGKCPATRPRKLAAVRAPSVAAEPTTKSAAASPMPFALLTLQPEATSTASAPVTRATTPALAATPRSRRRKRERTGGGAAASRPAIPRLESADRRRSGRIAKASASTAPASESSPMPNFGSFGFSPYLEGLILGNRKMERRTRSGVRSVRAVVGRNGAAAGKKGGRGRGKDKDKEKDKGLETSKDNDGPQDDVKAEMYLQLCILSHQLSHQLQTELGMVPFKTVEELRTEFLAPPAEPSTEGKSIDEEAPNAPPGLPDGWPPTPPQCAAEWKDPAIPAAKPSPKASRVPSPSAVPETARASMTRAPTETPPSSPELPLMASLARHRAALEPVEPHIAAAAVAQAAPTVSAESQRPTPLPTGSTDGGNGSWQGGAADPVDTSPIIRSSRPNIMSISALISSPTPQRRSPTPPSPPPTMLPESLCEWTAEDELATEILRGMGLCLQPLPVDVAETAVEPVVSAPATPNGTQTPDEPEVPESVDILDPHRMDILSRLDLAALFAREEEEYAKERATCNELYETMRYLAVYDDVVDRWRASELSRLRKQFYMRKEEVGRLLSAEREAAWYNFYNDRDSLLFQQEAAKVSHCRWQAESELNRISLCKPKSRAMTKVEAGLFIPRDSGAAQLPEGRKLYHQYGDFLQSAQFSGLQRPRERADLDRIRRGIARTDAATDMVAAITSDASNAAASSTDQAAEHDGEAADEDCSEDGDEEDDDEEDEDDDDVFSSSTTEISSLPSFSSVYSESESETTPGDETSGDPNAIDVDAVESSDEEVSLMAPQKEAQERPTKKLRAPPPGVRWWKAGRPLDS